MKLGQKIAIAYFRAYLALVAVLSKKAAARKAFALFCTPTHRTKKAFTPVFHKAEKLVVTVQGHPVNGFRWNKGGQPRVQVVHGFESASQNFETYITIFIEKGYEVLAFDAPAHGISGGSKITLPLYIDMLRTVYRQYGPVQLFLAHSFGGLALVHFLETLPPADSFRLALVAPATETVTAINQFFDLLRPDKQVRKEFYRIIEDAGELPPSHFSISRAMAHIKMPVLWVHDRDDTTTPLTDVQPVIDKQYPNVRFFITNGLGHRRIYRDRSVVDAITKFLSEV
ncbi:MAG TPA: alpha/beta fold hydrolase [Chitinophagaceae bacterium]